MSIQYAAYTHKDKYKLAYTNEWWKKNIDGNNHNDTQ